MSISCNIVRDLFMPYHDGVLSFETHRQVEAHLQHCEACRRHYMHMTRVTEWLPERVVLSAAKRERSYAQIARRLRHSRRWDDALRYTAAAVAVTAGVLITLAMQKNRFKDNLSAEE